MNHRIAILYDPYYLEFPAHVENIHYQLTFALRSLQENFQSEIKKKYGN